LEQALPETVLLCLQRSTAIDVLRRHGVEVFCLAEHVPPDQVAGKSSLDLLRHPATRAFAQTLEPLALMVFKPNERLEEAAKTLGATIIGGDPSAARHAENKIAFMEMARRAGIAAPRWGARRVDESLTFSATSDEFGRPFVMQGARGNAGKRTYLVNGEADFALAWEREAGKVVRVAAYADGTPATATGLNHALAPGNSLSGWIEPCRQVTGLTWLTGDPLGSCGNVWGDGTTEVCVKEIENAVGAIARELATTGYAAIFGVDFVCADGSPLVIETNPRMVASLPIATQMEVAAGRAPLLLLQLLQALGAGPAAATEEANLPPASQVIVHSLPDDSSGEVVSGVYRLDPAGEPQYLREGCWLSDLSADDEALLLIRRTGEPRTEGMEFARIYMKNGAGENQPGLREFVSQMRAASLPRKEESLRG